MALKSELVPRKPIVGYPEGADNLLLAPTRYRHGAFDGEVPPVVVPRFVNVTVLDEPDAADPLNQLRIFVVSVGDQLSYRFTATADAEAAFARGDFLRFMLAAFFLLGTEHSAEIRAAIAAAREAGR